MVALDKYRIALDEVTVSYPRDPSAKGQGETEDSTEANRQVDPLSLIHI